MTYQNMRGAAQHYSQIGTQTAITDATPHRLIQMLMDGALEKITIAKGHMARGNIADKGANVSWAISIIDGLRMSLDRDAGGELANNLDDLYEYMNRRLVQANLQNDPGILDEVVSLMREIKDGWDAMPESIRSGQPTPDVPLAHAVAR